MLDQVWSKVPECDMERAKLRLKKAQAGVLWWLQNQPEVTAGSWDRDKQSQISDLGAPLHANAVHLRRQGAAVGLV